MSLPLQLVTSSPIPTHHPFHRFFAPPFRSLYLSHPPIIPPSSPIMAELLDVPSSQAPHNSPSQSLSPPPTSKAGRKSKFTGEEDLVIAQEVFAADAHVAPHGETLTRFEMAARKANENPQFHHEVSGKNLQDRFKKLIDDFARSDNRDRLMSGTGGKLVSWINYLGICWKRRGMLRQ